MFLCLSSLLRLSCFFFFFFFNDTATTEIYTLSLHDALPISPRRSRDRRRAGACIRRPLRAAPRGSRSRCRPRAGPRDRKSTRLNSSHGYISYAVFCLKKKKKQKHTDHRRYVIDRPPPRTPPH